MSIEAAASLLRKCELEVRSMTRLRARVSMARFAGRST
jgi:hypothetical protein